MTALQSIIKEAKILRKKNPKMEWKKAVAQASAIYASKHKGKSPVGKNKAAPKKKKVGVIKSKPYKGYQYTIDENETGDFVDKYFTLSEAKKDLKRLISKDKKSGKYKKDFYRITHINTGKTIYGVKASKEVKKVLAKKGLKMPHGYSTTKRVRKVSGVKKKKISEQSILNRIHKVKDSVSKLDEAQHRHMMGMNHHPVRFTRINNDINGNPRYAIHFLDLINSEENQFLPFSKKYEYALKKAKKIGGKKYDNKQYGGGIVFQSYNIEDLEKKIIALRHTTPKIKI
jgi:hypothetical protein